MVSPKFSCDKNNEDSISMSPRWKLSMGVLLSGMIFNGCIYGFPNAASYSLKTQSGFDDESISWISSTSNLGVPIGSLLSGFIMNAIGRKLSTIICLGGSYMLSRVCLVVAGIIESKNVVFYLLVTGRFIAGISQGFCNCLILVYALELCRTQKQKNATGAVSAIFGYSATLLSYLAGSFVNWKILGGIQSIWAIPYIFGVMFFVPESPAYLLMKNRKSEAVAAMVKLYGSDAAYIIDGYEPNEKPTSGVLDFNRSRLKDLLIGSGMMFFYQFAGYTVVNNNINEILASGDLISFEEIRPENIASILISGAGLLGVILGLFLSIKANSRIKGKIIIMFSGIFSGLAFFMIGGAYYYRLDEEREDYTFLLLGTGSLVAHILFFSAGYGSICLPLIAQSQAPSARPLAMSVITTLGGAFAFLNAKSYYDLTALLGGRRDLSFFIYGLINLIGALYMAFAIKTKDR